MRKTSIYLNLFDIFKDVHYTIIHEINYCICIVLNRIKFLFRKMKRWNKIDFICSIFTCYDMSRCFFFKSVNILKFLFLELWKSIKILLKQFRKKDVYNFIIYFTLSDKIEKYLRIQFVCPYVHALIIQNILGFSRNWKMVMVFTIACSVLHISVVYLQVHLKDFH